MDKKNAYKGIVIVLGLVILASGQLRSHCQIPCGIYGDQMRIDMMNEDIDTIEKAVNSVKELQKKDEKNYNQIVRWITNKEEHASKIIEAANGYFLAQRINPEEKDEAPGIYLEKLELLHRIIVYSMRCKQTLDMENVRMLRDSVEDFEELYFAE